MKYEHKDTLANTIEALRAELATHREELRIMGARLPKLRDREARILEALALLDLEQPMQTSDRATRENSDDSSSTRASSMSGSRAMKSSFVLSDDAILAMASHIERHGPQKSTVLYDLLVKRGLMKPIANEAPYRSFGRQLGNHPQTVLHRDEKMLWHLKKNERSSNRNP